MESVVAARAHEGRQRRFHIVDVGGQGHIFVLLCSLRSESRIFFCGNICPPSFLLDRWVLAGSHGLLDPPDDVVFVFGRDVEVRRGRAAPARHR